MASIFWHNKNATNDANDRTNYTTDVGGVTAAGAGSLAADVLLFSGTGVGADDNWTMTAALAIQSYNFTGYTGNATDSGFTLTVNTAGTSTLIAGMTLTATGILDITAASHTLVYGGKQLHRLRLSTTGTVTQSDAADVDELIINAISGTLAGAFNITLRSGKLTRIDGAGTEANYTIAGNLILGAAATFDINGTAAALVILQGTLTGAFTINKTGTSGFRTTATANPAHTGTTVNAGVMDWAVPTSGSKQFGSGTITLAGGELGFRGNSSATFTLTNPITVTSAGGIIRTDRQSANNPIHVLSGAISLGGNLDVRRDGGSGDTKYTGVVTIQAGAGTRRIRLITCNDVITFQGVIADGGGNLNALEVQNDQGGTSTALQFSGNNTFANGLLVRTPASGTSGINILTNANAIGLGNVTIQTGARANASLALTIQGAFDLQGTGIWTGNQTITYRGAATFATGSTYTQGTSQFRPTVTPVTVSPGGKALGGVRFGIGSAGDKTINLTSSFTCAGTTTAIALTQPGTLFLNCVGTFTVILNGAAGNPGFRGYAGTRDAAEFFTVDFGTTTWQYTNKWEGNSAGYVNFDYTACTIRWVGATGSSAHIFRAGTPQTVKRLELHCSQFITSASDAFTLGVVGDSLTITELYSVALNVAGKTLNYTEEANVVCASGCDMTLDLINGTALVFFIMGPFMQGGDVTLSGGISFTDPCQIILGAGTNTLTTTATADLRNLYINHVGGNVVQLTDVGSVAFGLGQFHRASASGFWDLDGLNLRMRTDLADPWGTMNFSPPAAWFTGLEGATIACRRIQAESTPPFEGLPDQDLLASAPWFLHVVGGAQPSWTPAVPRTLSYLTCTGFTLDALDANCIDGGNNANVDFGFGGAADAGVWTLGNSNVPTVTVVGFETVLFDLKGLNEATIVQVGTEDFTLTLIPGTVRIPARFAPDDETVLLGLPPPTVRASARIVPVPLLLTFAIPTPFAYSLRWDGNPIPIEADWPPAWNIVADPEPVAVCVGDPDPAFTITRGPP